MTHARFSLSHPLTWLALTMACRAVRNPVILAGLLAVGAAVWGVVALVSSAKTGKSGSPSLRHRPDPSRRLCWGARK